MKKKLLLVVLMVVFVSCLTFTACDLLPELGPSNGGEVFTYETAYAEAQSLGYTGTLQEFMDSIKGKDGVDGIGIKSVTVNEQGKLIVTLTDDTIIDCGSVKGPQGEKGEQGEAGKDGADGTTPQLKVGEDNYWYVSYDNGETWTSLDVKATGDTTQTIEHSWKNCYTLVEADCLTAGKVLYACDDCGLVKMVEIPIGDGHTDNNNNGICDLCAYIINTPATTNTTITFYHTMGEHLRNILDAYIAEFNKIYPNITIRHEQIGTFNDVHNQIKTELNTNQGPSLAYCYPEYVTVYDTANIVVDLYEYMHSSEVIPAKSLYGNAEDVSVGMTQAEMDNFVSGFLMEGTQFGDSEKMLTLPFCKSTDVLYYNKTFFDENKLEVPTHWWCDDSCPTNCKSSMEYVCAEIKKIDRGCIPLGYDSESNWFITMCEQLGTKYTTFTPETNPLNSSKVTRYTFYNEDNVDFLERLNGWYQNGWITTKELWGAYTSDLFKATRGARSYMSIASSSAATYQRPTKVINADGKLDYSFSVGIAPIPQVDRSNPKTTFQGPSICMLKTGTDEQLMATWLFMKYLTTNADFQADFAMACGYLPVIKSVNDAELAKTNDGVKKYMDYLASADGGDNIAALAAKVAIEHSDAYFSSPAFDGASAARDQVGVLLQNCLLFEWDNIRSKIENALKNAFQTCESIYPTPQT